MQKESPLTRTYKHLTAKYILVAKDPEKQEALQERYLDAIGGETLEFEEEAPGNRMMRKRYKMSILRGLLYDRIAESELLRMAPLRETMLIACIVLTVTTFGFNYKNFGDVWDTVGFTHQTAEQKEAKKLAKEAEKEAMASLTDEEKRYAALLDEQSRGVFMRMRPDMRSMEIERDKQSGAFQ